MPLLDREFLLNEKFKVPETLRLDHDDIRAWLSRALTRKGPIGEAAERLAKVCLPHLEQEEKTVYPAFSLLHRAALSNVRADMAAALPLVFHCSAWHETLLENHEAMLSALNRFQDAMDSGGDTEFVGLAESLRGHERIEEEVMYPAVIWIGRYMRERLESDPN